MTNRQQLHNCDFLFSFLPFLNFDKFLACASSANLNCWDDVGSAKLAMLDELSTGAHHSGQRGVRGQNFVQVSEGAVLATGREAEEELVVFTTADKHVALGFLVCTNEAMQNCTQLRQATASPIPYWCEAFGAGDARVACWCRAAVSWERHTLLPPSIFL